MSNTNTNDYSISILCKSNEIICIKIYIDIIHFVYKANIQCQNGGVCRPDTTGMSVYCQCPPGYSGVLCQTPVPGGIVTTTLSPFCAMIQCQNGMFLYTILIGIFWFKI